MARNSVFSFVGHTAISLYGDVGPTDQETRASIEAFTNKDISRLRALVITDGGTPSAAQRKAFNDALNGRDFPAAVISSAMIARGAVTAMSWFNPKLRAFAPDALADAFRYLGIPPRDDERVWAEVKRLEVELGRSLKSIPLTFVARKV
jgi:hypothetical protein